MKQPLSESRTSPQLAAHHPAVVAAPASASTLMPPSSRLRLFLTELGLHDHVDSLMCKLSTELITSLQLLWAVETADLKPLLGLGPASLIHTFRLGKELPILPSEVQQQK